MSDNSLATSIPDRALAKRTVTSVLRGAVLLAVWTVFMAVLLSPLPYNWLAWLFPFGLILWGQVASARARKPTIFADVLEAFCETIGDLWRPGIQGWFLAGGAVLYFKGATLLKWLAALNPVIQVGGLFIAAMGLALAVLNRHASGPVTREEIEPVKPESLTVSDHFDPHVISAELRKLLPHGKAKGPAPTP